MENRLNSGIVNEIILVFSNKRRMLDSNEDFQIEEEEMKEALPDSGFSKGIMKNELKKSERNAMKMRGLPYSVTKEDIV